MASGPPAVEPLLTRAWRWMTSFAGGSVSPPDDPVLPVGVEDMDGIEEAGPQVFVILLLQHDEHLLLTLVLTSWKMVSL
ncbi:hypothetical protein ABVT39_010927 [Epinephelus coioides]